MTTAVPVPGGLLAQVVDVTLPTTTSAWSVPAAALGVVAASATATWAGWVLVGTWLEGRTGAGSAAATFHDGDAVAAVRPAVLDARGSHWTTVLLGTAMVATVLALASGVLTLVAIDAVPTTAAALTTPTALVLVARTLVLAVAVVLQRQRDLLAPREATLAARVAAIVAALTVAAGGARLTAGGWPLDTVLAGAALVAGGGAATLLWRRRPDLRRLGWAVVVPMAVAAIPAWMGVAPPTNTPIAAVSIAAPDGTLDVSILPARPGPAALHLYAFDDGDVPVEVVGGQVTVAGSLPTSLVKAGPNHLIAYGLDLPDTPHWPITVTTTGDLDATATATVARP